MFSPTVHTRFIALLGNPLGHSISPPMHNRVFEKLGMDYCYLPIEVTAEDLGTIFAAMKKMNFAGCNVTIPHKLAIMAHLDELDHLAETIGAVNTVRFQNGRSKGFNTDGEGFIRSLQEESGITPKGHRFLLFGCGGATRAIAMTLAAHGAERVMLCNRTEAKAEALAEEINRRVRPCAASIACKGKAQLTAAGEADILVNTTSIGMHPNEDIMPFPEACIEARHIVADIVYNPWMTKLLSTAEERGAKAVHGLGMLVWQGAAAFKIFTGREADVAAMKEEVAKLRKG